MFHPDESTNGPLVFGFAVVGFLALLVMVSSAILEIGRGFAAHVLPAVLPDRTPMSVKYGEWAGQSVLYT